MTLEKRVIVLIISKYILYREFVFETSSGVVSIRDNMQTLAPSLKIEANVIDCFAEVLNYEENLNNKGVRMKHYFHTAMIVSI